MVVAQEGEAEVPMNTARLKKHTGGDRIQARHLYGKEFTFVPTFTLVLATNHLPEFAAGGAALWARTKAILFGESFAGREDPELEPTIQGAELQGVAAWIVEGAKRYYTAGRLYDIDEVREATQQHKEAVDPLKALVGEIFEYDDGYEISRTDFNRRLKEWCADNGDTSAKYKPGSVKKQLLNRGVIERRSKDGWKYAGIRFPEDRASERQQTADGVTDIFGQQQSA
ncbi:hypothetical protein [Streptomyces sp. NBC_01750]|uniref:hypothetical protein n=1 Tax=Streptomyces sp. NBC_01750 TaxID=2975928 RepID=UPI002DD92C58|nr:hypothetical protein [Streptomyces sp. NBC_01750]WSD32200.1 hypothetical protein OG966_09960 [Streptomyces sp. NBC_01750]